MHFFFIISYVSQLKKKIQNITVPTLHHFFFLLPTHFLFKFESLQEECTREKLLLMEDDPEGQDRQAGKILLRQSSPEGG